MSDGLKKLRKGSEKMTSTKDKPDYSCNNCKCVRYNPCTCMKKKEK